MKASRLLPATLAASALLATAAILFMNVANAQAIHNSSAVHIAASVASTCQGLALAILVTLASLSFCRPSHLKSHGVSPLCLLSSLAVVLLATAASVAALVLLSREPEDAAILGSPKTPFVIAYAVVLGVAFTAQLVFLVTRHIAGRLNADQAFSLHTEEGSLSRMRIKAVPYSQTTVSHAVSKEWTMDLLSPPGSSGGKSTAETVGSLRSSFSFKAQPAAFKTRRTSTSLKTIRRPPSIESNGFRRSMGEDGSGFDSWDTSSVDTHDRQTVMDASPPLPRYLETIPASPTTSRSPSPGTPLDPPQRMCHRSRSYSPVPRPPPALTLHRSSSELHIHPLFRTDSPEAPPRATPGTSIVASVDAGKLLSERSITRMRSGSLQSTARSPLSRQTSHESFNKTSTPPNEQRSSSPVEERKMTPPIPEWILEAGSRTSLPETEASKLPENEATR